MAIGLLALLSAAASVAFAATHTSRPGPRPLKVACAQKRSGLLRYVSSTARCDRRSEQPVDFAKDGPVYACIRPDAANGIAHASARDARGTVRRVRGPGECGHDVQVILPALGPRSFCVDGPTHLLRNLLGGTPCHRKGEFKVILAKRQHKPKPKPNPEPEPTPAGNHPPTAAADAASTDEDHATAIAATANDGDADGDPIHVSSVATAGTKGAVAINPDGRIAYDPHGAFESLGAGESATDSFTYKVSDGSAESTPATVTVTVTGVDDHPVAHDDSATTAEDAAQTLHVLSNDADAEGEALHVASVDTTGTKGAVTINPDGTISYDPSGQFDGLGPTEQATDSFTYRAADAHGSSNAATVFLTITGVDDAPVISGVESTALSYDTGSAAAAITDTLSIADADSATIAGATVTIASAYVQGRDDLAFTPQSGIGGSWDATTGALTLSGAATKAQYEAALRSVAFHATDPTPSGSRRIDFVVDDGTAASAAASRDITVTHVNHAPVAADDSATTAADTTKTITVLANDTDSDLDALSVASVDTSGTAGTVTINPDGTIGYDPNGQFDDLAAGATATDTFTYKANDGTTDSPAALVTVTVTGVNDAPVLSGIESGALAYDTGSGPAAVTSALAVSDADDANVASATVTIASGYADGIDALSFTPQSGITGTWDHATGTLALSGSATKAQYEAALRSVTYDAGAPAPSGSRRIDFVVDDGHAANHASAVASRTITLTHVNHAPTATDDTASVGEDATTSVSVLGNDSDVDLDPLSTASVDTTGTKGVVTINPDGTISYDPNGQFESLATGATASDTFTYKANDGTSDSNAGTVNVTITGVNDAPVLTSVESSALSYDTGSGPAAITGSLAVSDVDNANLSWASVQIAAGHSAGHDALAFTNQNGIDGSYDAATGVLTLTGVASVADYETALRSVTFSTDATSDSGSRTISFQVDDDEPVNHASAVVTRDITVTHVNHPPTPGADSAGTDEDSAISSVNVLGNDSDVDGDTPLRVSSIDTTGTVGDVTLSAGTISYNPAGHFDSLAQGAAATDTFTYRAADPSDADSPPATVTVTVTGVDDAPALTQPDLGALAYGSDQAATAIAPNLTATDVDSTNLTGATIQIGSGYVNGKDVLSFTNTPSISGSWSAATGTLTLSGTDTTANYQAALRAVKFAGDNAPGVLNASRSVSFQVTDGTLTSAQAFRTIDVTHVNQAPTGLADSYSGAVGNTTLAVSTSPTGPHTTISGNVLSNDTDPDNPHSSLTASATSPTPNGAKVTMNSDGTFTYVPPQGFLGDDSFQYTVNDNDANDPKTGTGTVTVTVAGPRTWYVNAAAAPGGDGRSDAPFTTLSPLSTGGAADAKDGTGDRIFVYGSASNYTGGIVLEANQKLIGEPQGLTAGSTTLVSAGGSNPVVSASGASAVTLADGADVQRVDETATGAPAVSGTNVNTATIGSQTTISGSGGGVALDGGSGGITVDAAINTTGGHSVSVQNRTNGTVSFSGTVNDTGTGIQLRNNGAATVAFSNKIVASTGTSAAFSAANGGAVTATASGSTLTSTTGTALDVRGDTIGFAGLKFQSISANGAANGIVLSGTGSSAGLTVTGTGAAGSGGTIQSTTGHGISLSDTKNVSLNDIVVQNPQHAGIKGANVHGFSLTDSTITGAGAANSDPADASLAFNDTSGASDINVDGALTVTGNTLSNAYGGGLDIDNYAGTITNAIVMSNTIASSASAAVSKGSGIAFNLFGTASNVASLTRATITSNAITNFPSGDGIAVQGANTSGGAAPAGTYGVPSGSVPGAGASIIDISGNAIAGDPTAKLNGTGITASVTGRGQGNFSIKNNGTVAAPVRNMKAEGIATGAAGDVTVNFDVEGNHVNANNVLGSYGVSLGSDKNIQADTTTLSNPVVNAAFLSNDIAGSSGAGLRVLTRDSNGTTRVRISGNTIANPAQGATPGIRIDAGSSGSVAYNPTVCADITANSSGTGPADGFGNVAPGILLYKRSLLSTTYRFGLPGLSPDPAGAATVESFVAGNNPASATGGGTFAGKKAAVGNGDQFSNCTLPF